MRAQNIASLTILVVIGAAVALLLSTPDAQSETEKLVYEHARAWKTGDLELLDSLLHEDVVFAYPGRRLNKQETLEDLDYFRDNYTDTEVEIHKGIIQGDNVAGE